MFKNRNPASERVTSQRVELGGITIRADASQGSLELVGRVGAGAYRAIVNGVVASWSSHQIMKFPPS